MSLEARVNMPKCGAKSRQTGEPCRQPVREAGKRCRYHGGATPKGRDWHRRRYPEAGAAPSRWAKKELAWEVRDRQAEKRRAAMGPEERAEHEKRRRSQRPGTLEQRDRRKRNREAKAWLDKLREEKEASKPLSDPAANELAAKIRRLEEEQSKQAVMAALTELFS